MIKISVPPGSESNAVLYDPNPNTGNDRLAITADSFSSPTAIFLSGLINDGARTGPYFAKLNSNLVV
jgi:hypothetical protein